MKRRDRSTVDEMVLESAQDCSKSPGELGTESSSARGVARTRRGRAVQRVCVGMVWEESGTAGAKAVALCREAMVDVWRVVGCAGWSWCWKTQLSQ